MSDMKWQTIRYPELNETARCALVAILARIEDKYCDNALDGISDDEFVDAVLEFKEAVICAISNGEIESFGDFIEYVISHQLWYYREVVSGEGQRQTRYIRSVVLRNIASIIYGLIRGRDRFLMGDE